VHDFGILLSVATLWALAAISPGPNFLMTARVALTRSRRAGLSAIAGIALGTAIWGAAGCFGVQALFVAAPWMYLVLKILGAAWLVFIGVQLVWRSRRSERRARHWIERLTGACFILFGARLAEEP
jgi:threonine/homoserine/homoserine lactone efflux protein